MLGLKYSIVYEKIVITKDLKILDTKVKKNIKKSLEIKLENHPDLYSLPLRKPLGNLRKLRVGDYRIVFFLDENNKRCVIHGISHRKDIYQNVLKRI